MTQLALLQSKFQHYLLHNKPEIQESVINTEKISAQKRLSIYFDAYRYRLLDSLSNNYPILLSYLGFDNFSHFAEAYINQFPSFYRSIRWYGDTFSAFLQEKEEAFLAELADFEWKMTLSFDAAEDKVLALEEMAAIQEQAWATACFKPHPSLQLMRCCWNSVEIWEAMTKEQQLAAPLKKAAPVLWVLWRREYINRFYSLADDEAWALEHLVQGLSFGSLCEGLSKWHAEQEIAMQAASFLKGWIQSGLIADILLD